MRLRGGRAAAEEASVFPQERSCRAKSTWKSREMGKWCRERRDRASKPKRCSGSDWAEVKSCCGDPSCSGRAARRRLLATRGVSGRRFRSLSVRELHIGEKINT